MFTPTPSGQAGKKRLVLLLLIGVLCCSKINCFVQVHAYQATPKGQQTDAASTALYGASTAENDEDPKECIQTDEQKLYDQLSRKRESVRYQIIAAESCEPLARRMAEQYPDRFIFHATKWAKFPDGTDNIEIGGFSNSKNVISGEKVIFLASFHSNDTTLSQFQVMITLLQSFIESLTVVLPFSPVGTMERVTTEGQVATAATYAHSKSASHSVKKCLLNP